MNALYGRDFGDRVLRTLGEEIEKYIKESDGIASRFDADRFGIYSRHIEDWKPVLEHFQKCVDDLAHGPNIHLRMGVKPWQAGMEPVHQLDRARIACNKIRGNFRAQIMIFDDAMEQREDRDQRLMNDLSRALEQQELEIYYQPKYDIRSDKPKIGRASCRERV